MGKNNDLIKNCVKHVQAAKYIKKENYMYKLVRSIKINKKLLYLKKF